VAKMNDPNIKDPKWYLKALIVEVYTGEDSYYYWTLDLEKYHIDELEAIMKAQIVIAIS